MHTFTAGSSVLKMKCIFTNTALELFQVCVYILGTPGMYPGKPTQGDVGFVLLAFTRLAEWLYFLPLFGNLGHNVMLRI